MSGGLILGAAGAVVGGIYGGPSGAQWGFIAGSTIGGLLFPTHVDVPKSEGPRLSDLRVQTATFGAPIGVGYGTVRKAGNVIWATNIVETAHTQDVTQGGGKGGGGGATQQQTTFTYSVSLAVAFLEGPVIGFRRIWANNKLIYDVSNTAPITNLIQSNGRGGGGFLSVSVERIDATTVQANNTFRFYLGSATQQPDSLIQADKGAANTPAFRDTAYVVIQDLQLADFGNALPNIEAELIVTSSAASAAEKAKVALVTDYRQGLGIYVSGNARGCCTGNAFGATYLTWPNMKDGYFEILTYDSSGFAVDGTFYLRKAFLNGTITAPATVSTPMTEGYSTPWTPPGINKMNGGTTNIYASAWNPCDERAFLTWRALDGSMAAYVNLDRQLMISLGTVQGLTGGVNQNLGDLAQYAGNVYFSAIQSGDLQTVIYTINLAQQSYAPLYTYTPPGGTTSLRTSLQVTGRYWWLYVQRTTGGVYVEELYRFPHGSAVANASWTLTGSNNMGSSNFGLIQGWYIIDEENPVAYFIAWGTGIIRQFTAGVFTTVSSAWYTTPTPSTCAMFSGNAFVGGVNDAGNQRSAWWGFGYTQAGCTLSSIVSDLCTRAGMSTGDLDVTQLTDNVPGFLVGKRMTARVAIEPLMPAFYFDAVQSGSTLRFVKRGGASVATIPVTDLSAHSPDSEAPDPLLHTRKDETELPSDVEVTYIAQANNYQAGSQHTPKQTATNENKVSIALPIVLADDQAAQISEVNLYTAWLNRDLYSFKTGQKYLYLDPTDVVTVQDPAGNSFVVRLAKNDVFAEPGILGFDAVLDGAASYVSTATGAAGITPGNSMDFSGPTHAEYLDIPLMRDIDNYMGFYFAAVGYMTQWQGEQLYVSADGGQTWQNVDNGLAPLPAVIGTTLTALPDAPSRPEEFDYGSTVDVTLYGAGTLSSVTRDQVFQMSNFAVIGNELVQFVTATLISANTYRLSQLLRCRKGTTYNGTGHAAGERFVLLDPAVVKKIRLALADSGVARKYKPVSVGKTLQTTDADTFTCNAEALKPLPPVQVGGGRNAALDLIINWIPQTRLDATLVNWNTQPLGELPEAYSIDIIKAGSPVRTIAVSAAQTSTYTAAQQIADFGSTQPSITFDVYMVSALVGRGHATRATV